MRKLRGDANFTQQALAVASGVSRSAIARIEAGESSTQIGRLWSIAHALNTTPSVLLTHAETFMNARQS